MNSIKYIIEVFDDGSALATVSSPNLPDSVRSGGMMSIFDEVINSLDNSMFVAAAAVVSGLLTEATVTKPVVNV